MSDVPRKVFLSYAKSDERMARQIAADLGKRGFNVWVAWAHLTADNSWTETIEHNIADSDAVLMLVSHASVASKWGQYERNLILERTRHSAVPAVAAVIDPDADRAFRTGFLEVDFASSYYEAITRLAQVLSHAKPMPRSLGSASLNREVSFLSAAQHSLIELALEKLKEPAPPRAIAIVGAYGTGKTMILQMIASRAQREAFVDSVIFLNGATTPPTQVIEEFRSIRDWPEGLVPSPQSIVEILADRYVLVVIDEFEAFDDRARLQIVELLRPLIASQTRSMVLLSSALDTPELARMGAPVSVLGNMGTDEIRILLENTGVHLNPSDALALAHAAQGNPRKAWMIRNLLVHGSSPSQIIQECTIGDEVAVDNLAATALRGLSREHLDALDALRDLGTPASARTVGTLVGDAEGKATEGLLLALSARGIISVDESGRYSIHADAGKLIGQLGAEREPPPPGTLYLTIDSTLMPKEDIVELLETLNAIYVSLGGDSLVIREEEVGRFAGQGVPV